MPKDLSGSLLSPTRKILEERTVSLASRVDVLLPSDCNLDSVRPRLHKVIAAEISSLYESLVDDALTRLGDQAREIIAAAPPTLQNEFFDLDLQSTVKLALRHPAVQSLDFSCDWRRTIAVRAGSGTAFVSTAATICLFFMPYRTIWSVAAGVFTIASSYLIYQKAYHSNYAAQRDIAQMRGDTRRYIHDVRTILSNSIDDIARKYTEDFEQFCLEHGFAVSLSQVGRG